MNNVVNSRIDACIVGDPNACLEPNESCQAEEDGSACSCKPGFGRKKASDVCKGRLSIDDAFPYCKITDINE